MTYEQIFNEVKKYFIKANPSHFTQEFAFQFNITGEGEGIFYAAYKDGKFEVEPYDYRDRDVIFEADGDTFEKVASGSLEVIDAINAGKLSYEGSKDIARELLFLVGSKKAARKTETQAAEKAEEKPAVKESKDAPKPAAKKTDDKAVSEKAPKAKSEQPKAAPEPEKKPAEEVKPAKQNAAAAKAEPAAKADAKATDKAAKDTRPANTKPAKK